MHSLRPTPAGEEAKQNKKERKSLFNKPPQVIVEGVMKGVGEYSKKIGVFVPLGAPSIRRNKGEEFLSLEKELEGRKVVIVYESNSKTPSYLIVRDSVQMLPEVVVEVEGKKILFTLEQTPLDKANREVVCEKVAVGDGHVTVYKVMTAMPIMYMIQKGVENTTPKNVQNNYVISENTEVKLHGTDKKSTAREVIGSEIKTSLVEKALVEMVPERYRNMVPVRLKDKVFRFIVTEGNRNGERIFFLFTMGNHLSDIVDFVPQMLALKPSRVVVEIGGCEWYGAEISKTGKGGVLKVLDI
ncbi:MAG: hypothetical protein QXS93_02285 [Candidatus Micrarchaeia archaeon]